MNILVTGATGLLGHSLCPYLRACGHTVMRQSRTDGADIRLDLTDYPALARILDTMQPEIVIHLAAEAGAQAAKFQHFQADSIVSDAGFRALGRQQSHQTGWQKSVYEVYQEASLNLTWTPDLKQACDAAGLDFFTSPYALEIVDAVDPFVPAYKIGSGDITWLEILTHIAARQKPCLLATGAATLTDVDRAVQAILPINPRLALLQCNTNYTGSPANFAHVHLRVLDTYRRRYPELVPGLSDHTPGHTTVLGAVALGACIIEKHFTDDVRRPGPDHGFSMTPKTWREMVARTRELELSLGHDRKEIEANEADTVILQRRAIRARTDLSVGTQLAHEHLIMLRPCPQDALPPYAVAELLGRRLVQAVQAGEWIGKHHCAPL